MKATGIVRRIDDLGRVVIPKEIRKTLKVKEGMPLEIYTDKEGGIVLRSLCPFRRCLFFQKNLLNVWHIRQIRSCLLQTGKR